MEDVQDLGSVITEFLLHHRSVNLHFASKDVSGFLIQLLPFELNWSVHFVNDFIDLSRILIELDLVVEHGKTLRCHLHGQALRISLYIHHLILDKEFVLMAVQHSLADIQLFLLLQDYVVLVEPCASDRPTNFLPRVLLLDHDTVLVEQKTQLDVTAILIVITDLVDSVFRVERSYQAALDPDPDLLDYVFYTFQFDVNLTL